MVRFAVSRLPQLILMLRLRGMLSNPPWVKATTCAVPSHSLLAHSELQEVLGANDVLAAPVGPVKACCPGLDA